MALKSNFEDADFISSPFVDEIANPGDAIDRVKAAVDTELDHARITNEIKRRANAPSAKPKKPPTKPKGFAEPGLKNRKDFIDNIR